jgi:hypothetical protein
VPLVGAIVTEELNVVLSSDTWKFVGALTSTFEVRLLPDTVYEAEAELALTLTLPNPGSDETDVVTICGATPPSASRSASWM